MGFFGSRTSTYVSSVAYPLGEDGVEGADTLKRTIINAQLQGHDLADSITKTYLRGQGIALRNAFRYARDKYADGLPVSNTLLFDQPDLNQLRTILAAKHNGAGIEFTNSLVGTADFTWWAERYLTDTFGYDRNEEEFGKPPPGVDANAAVAFDIEPDGLIRILLMNAGGATTVVDYRPTDLKRMHDYVHACYQTVQVFNNGTNITTRAPNPGETDSVSVSHTIVERAGEIQDTLDRIEVDIVGGVATVETSQTVTVTSRPKYFLYEIGTGGYPTLDAWRTAGALDSPYFPSIPLRVANRDVTTKAYHDSPTYKTSKNLLAKVGANIEELSKQVNKNPQVGEIDYGFIVFGVALDIKAQEGKRYLQRYFSHLRSISAVTKIGYQNWENVFLANPTVDVVTPAMNTLLIYSEKNRSNNYDIKLTWNYIDTTIKAGQIFPGAKPGDCEVDMAGGRITFQMMLDIVFDNSKLYVRKQLDADSYEEMEIAGLIYENFIYKGHAVTISAYDMFHDPDETGFILPLNQGVIRDTPLIELTDLSYQAMHIVFNCYKVVKKKWYQTGIFAVILVIIAIILCVIFPPAGVAGLAAVLAGGAALVTMVTLVIAAVLYVLAMMVLFAILAKLATKAFGPTWGPIIAMVLMIVAQNYAGAANAAAAGASTTPNLISASNILQATTFVANAYGAYANGKMQKIIKEQTGLETEFDKQMDEIARLTELNLDTTLDMIDIQGYTEASFTQMYELPSTFINRTLLTGSDICEITSGMVSGFAELGLQLPTTG